MAQELNMRMDGINANKIFKCYLKGHVFGQFVFLSGISLKFDIGVTNWRIETEY